MPCVTNVFSCHKQKMRNSFMPMRNELLFMPPTKDVSFFHADASRMSFHATNERCVILSCRCVTNFFSCHERKMCHSFMPMRRHPRLGRFLKHKISPIHCLHHSRFFYLMLTPTQCKCICSSTEGPKACLNSKRRSFFFVRLSVRGKPNNLPKRCDPHFFHATKNQLFHDLWCIENESAWRLFPSFCQTISILSQQYNKQNPYLFITKQKIKKEKERSS